MRRAFVLLSCLFIIMQSNACPFCGCGGGNLYMGLLPDFQHQFFGVRYNYSEYHTVLANDTSQHSKNYYNTIELWYGIHINPKMQVLVFAPYNLNKQIDDDGISTKNGLGDISVLGQYEIFHAMHLKKNHSFNEQQLWLGGGLKLPTGVFNAAVNDSTTTLADINAQLGTGSVDFLLNGLYSVRMGNFGLNINGNYKINTMHDNIKYGNKTSFNAIAYYRLQLKKNNISPNIGFNYEHVATSTLTEALKQYVPYTESHVFTGSAGIEYNIKHLGMGLNAQLPIEQNFAGGQTQLKLRVMAHITIAI